MSKQAKLGFDRNIAPLSKVLVPLYDFITGEPLRNISDQILYTEISAQLEIFYLSDRATSLCFNQDKFVEPIPIEEQFPIETEVSSSLLGIPRSEQQLSLFSDVSTYGIDNDVWEYFTFEGLQTFPQNWYNRKNAVYGSRFPVRFKEGVEEQALYLEGFPVNYTYPWGPVYANSGRYNEPIFQQYLRFITLGKAWYAYFRSRGLVEFAEANFIPDFINIIDAPVSSDTYNIVDVDVTYGAGGAVFKNSGLYVDVDYGPDIDLAFARVENWTLAWTSLLNESFPDPFRNIYTDTSEGTLDIALATFETSDSVRPGYSSNQNYTALLQSKQTFRYQPGRISGFTFGVRFNTDTSTSGNYIEFGCSNNTDEYLFQLKGAQFNIIRRSTIPLSEELLERQGLPSRFQRQGFSSGGFSSQALFETAIPREFFNGDPLDGNGRSRYLLSFEDVTMYKIEFGWYGAIGAKFYAYVPFGNEGARWVLMHTLIIENGFDKPCLQNPNFRFKYVLGITATSQIQSPVYFYKYGASYYIDGGDQGSTSIFSASNTPKPFVENSAAIGLFPKAVIPNQFGDNIENGKIIYPKTISVSSSGLAKMEARVAYGSPEGHHFHYSPSIKGGIVSAPSLDRNDVDLTVSSDGTQILAPIGTLGAGTTYSFRGIPRKIIADGLYNVYIKEAVIDEDLNLEVADIYRRTDYNLVRRGMNSNVFIQNGDPDPDLIGVDPKGRTFNGSIKHFVQTYASTVPLSGEFIKVHFLNPITNLGRHYRDFVIGVTPYVPSIDTNNNLRFDDSNDTSFTNTIITHPETTYAEWCAFEEIISFKGAEYGEIDPTYGIRFDLNPELRNPLGGDSGTISGVVITTNIVNFTVSRIESTNLTDRFRLYLGNEGVGSSVPIKTTDVELGVAGLNTGIKFLGFPTLDEESREFILIDGDPSQSPGYDGKIQLRIVEISDNFQVTSYDENGNLFFQEKRVLETSITRFDVKPLYLFIIPLNGANINNIVVEEITKETTSTHTPQWIHSDDFAPIAFSGNSSLDKAPCNFVSNSRSSSVRIDTQTEQPLRPSTTIYTTYIDGGDTQRISLDNIFGPDRKYITKGLYNDTVTYFTVGPIDSNNETQQLAETSIIFEEQY